jgi:GAF domain-containing protein
MPDPYVDRLAKAATLGDVVDVVRPTARRLTGADGVTFVLRDGDLCFYADEDAVAPLWKGQRFPMSECISGWAMIHGESVSVPDIAEDDRIPYEAYRPTFVRSLLMVPVGQPAVAAIGAYWGTVGGQEGNALSALERLAAHAADAVDRVGLDGAPWAPNFRLSRSAGQRAG